MASPSNIIAVGGGKGGIGKSILCTNLAVGLALCGQKVVLMDTDFGASNLHALLGICNPRYGFQDFFSRDSVSPNSLLLDTGIDNLKFISGAGDSPGSANLDSEKIQTLSSFITELDADTVFLDLGPGTPYNVLDFFNLSHQGLVLTTPEMTSVMKSFSFIRAALFRKLMNLFHRQPHLQRLVDHSDPAQADFEVYTFATLKEKLQALDPDRVPEAEEIVRTFQPGLVVNRVRTQKDLLIGDNLIRLTKKYLEVEPVYLGYLIESDRVRDSVDEMVPFLIQNPQSRPSENLQKILGMLTHSEVRLRKKDGKIFVSKQVRLSSGWGN